jgi:hypothetical protein
MRITVLGFTSWKRMCVCIHPNGAGIIAFLSGFVAKIIWLAVGFIGRVDFLCC